MKCTPFSIWSLTILQQIWTRNRSFKSRIIIVYVQPLQNWHTLHTHARVHTHTSSSSPPLQPPQFSNKGSWSNSIWYFNLAQYTSLYSSLTSNIKVCKHHCHCFGQKLLIIGSDGVIWSPSSFSHSHRFLTCTFIPVFILSLTFYCCRYSIKAAGVGCTSTQPLCHSVRLSSIVSSNPHSCLIHTSIDSFETSVNIPTSVNGWVFAALGFGCPIVKIW